MRNASHPHMHNSANSHATIRRITQARDGHSIKPLIWFPASSICYNSLMFTSRNDQTTSLYCFWYMVSRSGPVWNWWCVTTLTGQGSFTDDFFGFGWRAIVETWWDMMVVMYLHPNCRIFRTILSHHFRMGEDCLSCLLKQGGPYLIDIGNFRIIDAISHDRLSKIIMVILRPRKNLWKQMSKGQRTRK